MGRNWANRVGAGISIVGSLGAGMAARAGRSVEVLRAVGPDEAASIERLGRFSQSAESAESGKYFAQTLEGARKYAQMAVQAYHKPQSIYGTVARQRWLGKSFSVDGGISSYIVSPKYLPRLTPFLVE